MKTVNINFTQDQIAILNDALILMPYKFAAPLISHINAEIVRNHTCQEKEGSIYERLGQSSESLGE